MNRRVGVAEIIDDIAPDPDAPRAALTGFLRQAFRRDAERAANPPKPGRPG
jgi:hypothetical protein